MRIETIWHQDYRAKYENGENPQTNIDCLVNGMKINEVANDENYKMTSTLLILKLRLVVIKTSPRPKPIQ